MIATMRGFIPALERRLSIPIKSGSAAKVVPKPATKPRISDRWNRGTEARGIPWHQSLATRKGDQGRENESERQSVESSDNNHSRFLSTPLVPPPMFSEAFIVIFWAGTGTSGNSKAPVPHIVLETAFHLRRVRKLQTRMYPPIAISCRRLRAS